MIKLRRALAAALLCVLLANNTFAAVLPEREHGDLTVAELEELHFDETAFRDLCAEIADAAEGDGEGLESMLAELKQMFLLQDTETTLSYIHSDRDVTDTAAAERYLTLLDRSYDVEERMNETLVTVLDSPWSGLVDQDDPVFSMFLEDYAPLTREEKDLSLRETDLIEQYESRSGDVYTADISGKTFSGDALYEAWARGKISQEDYDQASLQIAQKRNQALAPIYVELVETRRAQAEYYGFSGYAEMEDQYAYFRDFDASEIRAFSELVKEYIVPLAVELRDEVLDALDAGAYETRFTEEELMTLLREGVTEISPELIPTLDYMEDHGCFDIAWSENKISGAYTTMLPYTGAPYLMMQPERDDSDYTCLVHEFGHSCAFFSAESPYLQNVDLAEVHSQALELLMMDGYDQVFGNDADAERLYVIYSMLMSMVDGCMMDELERWAYEQSDLTADSLNAQYMTLLKDYGYYDRDDPANRGYDWVDTAHIFSHPLYYISYSVSAAAALSLWQRALEDWNGAVDIYLELLGYGEMYDFYWTLEQVGLEDPLSESSLQALAETVSQGIFTADHPEPSQEPEETVAPSPIPTAQSTVTPAPAETIRPTESRKPEPEPPMRHEGNRLLLLGMAVLVTVCVTVGIVLTVFAMRRRRKK